MRSVVMQSASGNSLNRFAGMGGAASTAFDLSDLTKAAQTEASLTRHTNAVASQLRDKLLLEEKLSTLRRKAKPLFEQLW